LRSSQDSVAAGVKGGAWRFVCLLLGTRVEVKSLTERVEGNIFIKRARGWLKAAARATGTQLCEFNQVFGEP
jgi:hypothetical protein